MKALSKVALVICSIIILIGILWIAITYGPEFLGSLQSSTVSVRELSQNPESYEGQQVAVIGYVSNYVMADDGGYHIPLSGWPSNFVPNPGVKYKVTGTVIYGPNPLNPYGEKVWMIDVTDMSKV